MVLISQKKSQWLIHRSLNKKDRWHYHMHFHERNLCVFIQMSLAFDATRTIENNASLVRVMAWRGTSDKPLPEPKITQLLFAIFRKASFPGTSGNSHPWRPWWVPLGEDFFLDTHHDNTSRLIKSERIDMMLGRCSLCSAFKEPVKFQNDVLFLKRGLRDFMGSRW